MPDDDSKEGGKKFVPNFWWGLDPKTFAPFPLINSSEVEEWKHKDIFHVATTTIAKNNSKLNWVTTTFSDDHLCDSFSPERMPPPIIFETYAFLESTMLIKRESSSLDDSLKGHWALVSRVVARLCLSGPVTIEVTVGKFYQEHYRELIERV